MPQNGAGDMQPSSSLEIRDKSRPSGQLEREMDADIKVFNIIFAFTQCVGLLSVVLVAVWTTKFRGGFAGRSNPNLEFNWHPLFMTIGLIYLSGSSIMIYRALRTLRKQKLKIFHATIHSVTVACILFAQVAVLDSHNLATPPIPNFYTLHSWIGLTSMIIFIFQWICGLAVFLFPGAALTVRAKIMPWHVFLGLSAFVLAIAAALSGLLEKAIFTLKASYGDLPGEGLLINFIGMSFILFGLLVVYLSSDPQFKRYPRPEDGALLQSSPN